MGKDIGLNTAVNAPYMIMDLANKALNGSLDFLFTLDPTGQPLRSEYYVPSDFNTVLREDLRQDVMRQLGRVRLPGQHQTKSTESSVTFLDQDEVEFNDEAIKPDESPPLSREGHPGEVEAYVDADADIGDYDLVVNDDEHLIGEDVDSEPCDDENESDHILL
jgi:hypothetical protein